MASKWLQDETPILEVSKMLGIDFAHAIRSDILTPQTLSQMMITCVDCWQKRKCSEWRSSNMDTSPTTPPSFCPAASHLLALVLPKADLSAMRPRLKLVANGHRRPERVERSDELPRPKGPRLLS